MSDAAERQGAAVGSALARAREARGLTQAQAAEQLRLAPAVVRAMEEGHYRDLGPAVFARGHLRKFAALVGADEAEVLADYDGSSQRAAESTLIPPASAHTPVRDGRGAGRAVPWTWAVAAALLAVALAGWWWWQSRPAAPAEGSQAPAVAPAMEPATEPAIEPDLELPLEQASPDEAAPVDGAAVEAGIEVPAAEQTSRLRLQFSGPCWLEVYDASGQRLAYELAGAGGLLAFDGPAPWRVVLGDARNVRVHVNDQPVTLPEGLRPREAAQLAISVTGDVDPVRQDS